MASLKTSKRSFAAHKGHFNIALASFNAILDVKPQPTSELVEKSYKKVQDRIEALFNSFDSIMVELGKETSETVDETKEIVELEAYFAELANTQAKVETYYVEFKIKCNLNIVKEESTAPNRNVQTKPLVRLTSLSPPTWNGNKADFYTWKDKFTHIMSKAGVNDNLTQLCYLQNNGVIPSEYQTLIVDCSSITEAWVRLEERVPRETIKYEVIGQFRKLKPLLKERTPVKLREFANEVSLFCRRMSDLGLHEDNYTCVIMQDVYERLDIETALNYRSRIELRKEFGQNVKEDLNSLCAFIRSEATTLELARGSSRTSSENLRDHPPKKIYSVQQSQENESHTDGEQQKGDNMQPDNKIKCQFGCGIEHRLVDCSKYIEKSPADRLDAIKKSFRCFICLGISHSARNCPRRKENWKCKLCQQTNHHWTLCLGKRSPPLEFNPSALPFERNVNKDIPKTQNFCSKVSELECSINDEQMNFEGVNAKNFSPVVVVDVKTGDGSWKKAKCLLDTGSNSSLVRTKFAHSVNFDSNGVCDVQFGIAGGGVHHEKGEEFEIHLRAREGEKSYVIMATGIRKPCFNTQPIPCELFSKYEHLKEEKDNIYMNGGEIDLLIGLDYAPLILPEMTTRAASNPDNSPSVAHTRLGCYIFGGLHSQKSCSNDFQVNFLSVIEEDDLRSFFYGDILGVKPTSTCVCSDKEISQSSFIKHVKATTSINEDGRVNTLMPWSPGYPEKLPKPNNFHKAFDQMLKREIELKKSGKLEIYNEEIRDLVARCVVRILGAEEANAAVQEPGWFLNHLLIERPDKNSSKLRLVFDSASKYKGVSLNDALEKGPDYMNSIFSCFLKWREDTVAINGDISKMFNQVAMDEADRPYHRFIWRYGDLESDVLVFQWQRLIFGDKPSPDLAAYSIKLLADNNVDDYPIGSSILQNSTYVDDVTHSVPDDEAANNAIKEVDAVLSTGKFSIKVWNSNSPSVDRNPEKVVDVLGHQWNKESDTVTTKFKDLSLELNKLTKRVILGCVSKGWDPFGHMLPVAIRYRIDLQKIWQGGYSWDEKLPPEYEEVWTQNIAEMQKLSIEVDRCLKPKGVVGLPQLHAFSDGGDNAFGTCVFLRWPTVNGIALRLVAAKAFVAPLKRKTIPRLELMGVVAMARLTNEVISALGYKVEMKRFWVDSEVVIYWLQSQSSRYKPFVSCRIQEFQDTHPKWKEEVQYVPTNLNPADCLTKPIPVEKLKSWHNGEYCSFLKLPMDLWPEQFEVKFDNLKLQTFQLEEKNVVNTFPRRKKRKNVCAVSNQRNDVDEQRENLTEVDFGHEIAAVFSSWLKLARSVAYLIQSMKNASFSNDVQLTPKELSLAEQALFLICQKPLQEDIEQTKRRFHKLSIVKDQQGLIRAKGRLEKTSLPEEIKHPILLPGEHPLVRLFALHYHRKYLHQGYRVVVANIAKYGIVIGKGVDLLKSIASWCIFCRIRRRKLLQQRMGDLPAFRVQPSTPPFTSVALDFFGNLKIKLTRNTSVNGSVLIITCTTTRCIHLELCLTMDTSSFLRAWRRFVSIRGVHPNHAFSDNFGSFKESNKLISQWIGEWDRYTIQREMTESGTLFAFGWDFNVPTASHMNGVVESLINSVRKGLDASVTNYTKTLLTFEEWSTVLSEVTYIINSRPLFPVGDPIELNCITGNDLLYPHGQPRLPQLVPQENRNSRDMFKIAQGKVDMFWETWITHFPPQLLNRNKWFHVRDNLQVGDLVINLEPGMKGKSAPRSLWKKGIVTKTHPGSSGLVRSVTIRD